MKVILKCQFFCKAIILQKYINFLKKSKFEYRFARDWGRGNKMRLVKEYELL